MIFHFRFIFFIVMPRTVPVCPINEDAVLSREIIIRYAEAVLEIKGNHYGFIHSRLEHKQKSGEFIL
ncbi:hypothetical protein VN24_10075 [Paenibacillus beijingensis]|uniref:Uncharacterized protein n=1 Tax=Paenibacillus beijingensis TaxID=1126833 RepID=A0A0D5NIX0_9BACL|nr:hypothetical protein VN24_10075 [Paenibacillus beijingensis]